MKQIMRMAMLLLGLAVAPTCTSRRASTGEVGQEADGCGAWRYRGGANATCRYRGVATKFYPIEASGTCLNDSQVACTYANVRCEFELSETETVTACVDKTEACQGNPPESDPVNPNPVTLNLSPGSTLCDPVGTPAELANFCDSQFEAFGTAYEKYKLACKDQWVQNVGGARCCLDCPAPSVPPGLAGKTAEELGAYGGAIYGCGPADN
jgi:hypothetical protein